MDQTVTAGRSVNYSLTEDDYVRAYKMNLIKTYLKPRTWLRYLLGVFIALAVLVSIRGQLPQDPLAL